MATAQDARRDASELGQPGKLAKQHERSPREVPRARAYVQPGAYV